MLTGENESAILCCGSAVRSGSVLFRGLFFPCGSVGTIRSAPVVVESKVYMWQVSSLKCCCRVKHTNYLSRRLWKDCVGRISDSPPIAAPPCLVLSLYEVPHSTEGAFAGDRGGPTLSRPRSKSPISMRDVHTRLFSHRELRWNCEQLMRSIRCEIRSDRKARVPPDILEMWNLSQPPSGRLDTRLHLWSHCVCAHSAWATLSYLSVYLI